MKFRKVFEDNDILVVDKPAGLVVNRSQTIQEKTLQDQLVDYFKLDDLGIGDRAGIVHRLDRGTSGLLVVAKSQKVFEFLQKQFKQRRVNKEYIALVHGRIEDTRGLIAANIGRIRKFGKFGIVKEGRESATEFKVVGRYKFDDGKFSELIYSASDLLPFSEQESRSSQPFNKAQSLNSNVSFTKSRINYLKNHAREYTLLRIKPLSGRTHQIRVHLKSIGSPAVSDSLYTPNKLLRLDLLWCSRLFLHASFLEFRVFKSKPPLKFASNLPNDLKNAMLNLVEKNQKSNIKNQN